MSKRHAEKLFFQKRHAFPKIYTQTHGGASRWMKIFKQASQGWRDLKIPRVTCRGLCGWSAFLLLPNTILLRLLRIILDYLGLCLLVLRGLSRIIYRHCIWSYEYCRQDHLYCKQDSLHKNDVSRECTKMLWKFCVLIVCTFNVDYCTFLIKD